MTRRERLAEDDSYREWKGGYRSYDIVKEACIAFGVILALAVVLTILFSSPDEKPSTVQSWARTDPVDFVTTATTELDGSSGTGRLRTSVQPRVRRPAHPVHPSAEVAGREPSGRHRAGLRTGAAALDHRPAGAAGRGHRLRVGLARPAGEVDHRLRERAGQGERHRRQHRDLGPGRQLRAAADDDGRAARLRAERWARRRAPDQQAVLPDRLHQAAPVHGRRGRALEPRRGRAPARGASGE